VIILAYGGCDKNNNLIEFLIFPSFKSNSLFPPLLWISFDHTLNSIVPASYKCSLVPLQIVVLRMNEGIESIL